MALNMTKTFSLESFGLKQWSTYFKHIKFEVLSPLLLKNVRGYTYTSCVHLGLLHRGNTAKKQLRPALNEEHLHNWVYSSGLYPNLPQKILPFSILFCVETDFTRAQRLQGDLGEKKTVWGCAIFFCPTPPFIVYLHNNARKGEWTKKKKKPLCRLKTLFFKSPIALTKALSQCGRESWLVAQRAEVKFLKRCGFCCLFLKKTAALDRER